MTSTLDRLTTVVLGVPGPAGAGITAGEKTAFDARLTALETGIPIATGVSGLGAGIATFLATPSSANLRAALTDETGTGAAVFATSPTITTPKEVNPESPKHFSLGTTTAPAGSPDASTTSTGTYATAFTDNASVVLPAGTWKITARGGCAFINSAAGTIDFYVEIDGAGALTRTPSLSATVYSWWEDHASNSSVVSDGVTPIVINLRYRSSVSGTTTPQAPQISLNCVRTA